VFPTTSVTFLGHRLTPQSLIKQDTTVQAIVDFPVPKDRKEVERFHGICQWHSPFIHHYATRAEPISRILRKDVPWFWGPKQQTAFNELKQAVVEEVVLSEIDYNKEIFLKCDASASGIRAVLCHNYDGSDRPIAFLSRLFKKSERAAHIYEKELFA